MRDPDTLRPGPPLQLTVDNELQLYGHTEAVRHPLDLTGELYRSWVVLRGLEDALARHPLNDLRHDDRLDSLAELHIQARVAVNEARWQLHDLWAQQVELLAR